MLKKKQISMQFLINLVSPSVYVATTSAWRGSLSTQPVCFSFVLRTWTTWWGWCSQKPWWWSTIKCPNIPDHGMIVYPSWSIPRSRWYGLEVWKGVFTVLRFWNGMALCWSSLPGKCYGSGSCVVINEWSTKFEGWLLELSIYLLFCSKDIHFWHPPFKNYACFTAGMYAPPQN